MKLLSSSWKEPSSPPRGTSRNASHHHRPPRHEFLMTEVTLAPVTDSLRRRAVEQGWFRDETQNRKRGFGKGARSVLAATQAFGELLERAKAGDPSVALLGIYEGSNPVGYFVTSYLGESRRAVQFDLMIEDLQAREGSARVALRDLLEILFSETDRAIFRVQAEVLSTRKGFITLLRENGFTQEGIHQRALWVDGDSYNTVALRLLRPDWVKMQKETEITDGPEPS